MNKAAQTLGRLAKGVPKNYTAAELARRNKRLADARLKRWKKPGASDNTTN
jgi:hypothetical protein